MLSNISELGEIAYHEERDRKQLLIEQSNSLIVIITLLITFLGIILPIVIKNINSMFTQYIYLTFCSIIAVLFASLICAIVVQWRMKYNQFIDAMDFFELVKENQDEYLNKSAFLTKKIANLGDTTKSIRKNNNKRAKLIVASHILVFVSIFLIIIATVTILIF